MNLGFGEQRAVGRNRTPILKSDGSFLAAENRVLPDEDILPDGQAIVVFALGIQYGIVIDGGVVPDDDFMGMPQGYIPPENDPPANFLHNEGIKNLAEKKAEGSRNPRKKEYETFIFEEEEKTPVSNKDLPVFRKGRAGLITEKFMNAA